MRTKTKVLVLFGISVLMYCAMLIWSIVYGGADGSIITHPFVEKGWPLECMRESGNFDVEVLYGAAVVDYLLFLVVTAGMVILFDRIMRVRTDRLEDTQEMVMESHDSICIHK